MSNFVFPIAATSGLVFGLPLSQCIDNERGALQARQGTGGSGPGRGRAVGPGALSGRGGASRSSAGSADEGGSVELRRKSHHGSRASFSSLVEAPRHDDVSVIR